MLIKLELNDTKVINFKPFTVLYDRYQKSDLESEMNLDFACNCI